MSFFQVERKEGNNEGGDEIFKNTSSLRNHVLPKNAKLFNIFLAFLELQNTSQPDDTSELSTDDGNINQIKSDKISVGGRFKYYLLPCNPYG